MEDLFSPFILKDIFALYSSLGVGSYFVSGLEIHQYMPSWPLGFLLKGLLLF
jgi:hypothetical protein